MIIDIFTIYYVIVYVITTEARLSEQYTPLPVRRFMRDSTREEEEEELLTAVKFDELGFSSEDDDCCLPDMVMNIRFFSKLAIGME